MFCRSGVEVPCFLRWPVPEETDTILDCITSNASSALRTAVRKQQECVATPPESDPPRPPGRPAAQVATRSIPSRIDHRCAASRHSIDRLVAGCVQAETCRPTISCHTPPVGQRRRLGRQVSSTFLRDRRRGFYETIRFASRPCQTSITFSGFPSTWGASRLFQPIIARLGAQWGFRERG